LHELLTFRDKAFGFMALRIRSRTQLLILGLLAGLAQTGCGKNAMTEALVEDPPVIEDGGKVTNGGATAPTFPLELSITAEGPQTRDKLSIRAKVKNISDTHCGWDSKFAVYCVWWVSIGNQAMGPRTVLESVESEKNSSRFVSLAPGQAASRLFVLTRPFRRFRPLLESIPEAKDARAVGAFEEAVKFVIPKAAKRIGIRWSYDSAFYPRLFVPTSALKRKMCGCRQELNIRMCLRLVSTTDGNRRTRVRQDDSPTTERAKMFNPDQIVYLFGVGVLVLALRILPFRRCPRCRRLVDGYFDFASGLPRGSIFTARAAKPTFGGRKTNHRRRLQYCFNCPSSEWKHPMASKEGPIILSTETPALKTKFSIGAAAFHGAFVILVVGILATIVGVTSTSRPDLTTMFVNSLVGIAAIGGVLAFYRLVQPRLRASRGTWTLTDRGIAFRPLRGGSAELQWDTIARVRWSPTICVLVSEQTGICIPWKVFGTAGIDAMHFVEDALKPRFNLTTHSPKSSYLRRTVSAMGYVFSTAVMVYIAWARPTARMILALVGLVILQLSVDAWYGWRSQAGWIYPRESGGT
jgi:hypothetical protein